MPRSETAGSYDISKMWYIHTMDYYSAIKKNGIILFVATWTDLEVVVILSKVKSDREG